ncbi:MAG: hypothetical protein CMG60_07330 [Candidatus Marinimicrobia bacterium]|nr:hypothetical protein [Candidatus Neomarinimicrobiota bacterium]|tara:strand:+ start:2160 stop:2540 length:381 start_codon:yes stop_codon:yes gene_type:complete
MRKLTLIFIVISIYIQTLEAGCGGCSPRKLQNTKVNGLLETIPKDNYLRGNVLISCGMCNFMSQDNDCSLAIKVGKNVISVVDIGIDEHGDSHANDGYCNVIKKVYIEGVINYNKINVEKMEFSKI